MNGTGRGRPLAVTNRADERPPTDGPVVHASELTKVYGEQRAVDGLDLDITRGSIVGLVGPSGSGKTTTVRMMTGAQRPTSGKVTVFGQPPAEFGPRERARLGYMPQLNALYPNLSIAENLKFVASIYGVALRHRRSRLRDALSFVDLTEHRRKLLRDSSGGMQRRVALAATLLHEPDLLFLDEPTAGIDPVLRRKFWERFAELKRSGRTLCVTTQYVGEAAYCDVVAVLAEGQLVAADTPDGLRRTAFGGELVDVVVTDPVDPGALQRLRRREPVLDVEQLEVDAHTLRLLVTAAEAGMTAARQWADSEGLAVEAVRQHVPSFDDVFVAVLERWRTDG